MLIAQLSDPHLCRRGQLYQGLVDSNAMFAAALRHLRSLDPAPDLVLLTGDVTETGTSEAYALAQDMLGGITQPLLAIPGNHDERQAFRRAFPNQPYAASAGPLHCDLRQGPIRILGLDITVPGEHHGEMDDAACAWLEARLAEAPDRPTLLMMHQPPVASGMGFIDEYFCRGGDRLAAILARYTAVERVLCGHIHRFMQCRFGGTMLLTAPSTTTAIALRLAPGAEPASFLEPPAILLHQWQPGLGLVTHYSPIGAFPGPFDFF